MPDAAGVPGHRWISRLLNCQAETSVVPDRMIVPVSDPQLVFPPLLIAGKITAAQGLEVDLAPGQGRRNGSERGLRPSPYSVFLHESCRYPSPARGRACLSASAAAAAEATRGPGGVVERRQRERRRPAGPGLSRTFGVP